MPRRSRPLLIAAALLAMSALALVVAVIAVRPGRPVAATTPAAATPAPALTRAAGLGARAVVTPLPPAAGLLDGVPLAEAQAREHAADLPVAVMVDNWVEARPQIGLDRAELVYEGLVEFGITRFMAVYWRNDAPRIEPVRSARTQFLAPLSELDAVYAHVGAAAEEGPADAESQMRQWGIRTVDEEAGSGAITRDPARRAPHNAMTSTAALRAYARARGWIGAPELTPWPFAPGGNTAGTPATAVAMDFDITASHGGAFTVRWEYDAAAHTWRRFQAGAPHVDGLTHAQLTATNVIVQVATVRAAGDRSGHVLYDLEGSGRALVLTGGHAVEATWHKDSRTGRTRFLDAAGRAIPLTPGPTWVELLPAGQPLSVAG